ncbi:MAG TPA: hypothetical protein VJR89_28675 [Polyangiales bacterium]|nr:hypothetical protein [Polyangiales bacterium]
MSLRGTLSLCVLAALHASCTSGESSARTEVLLQVDAVRMIRLQAERMSLDIASGPLGGEMLSRGEVEVFDLTAEEFRWPASLALVAKAGHEQHVFDVTVTVEKGGEALARTRVRSSFLK